MTFTAYPETVSALTLASNEYEEALAQNDIAKLDALFSDNPNVIRLGATENLFGAEEIAAFRRARTGGAPPRERLRREIVALGPDAGCVTIVFRNLANGRIGRQSQTWVREAESWRVLIAHVSFLAG
ncbi:AtzH-like domain-containing protein [Asaia lannensis]|uniref:Nuclear transport factor 2 family protein n=1 Tax=Asaia lannensis NBRC 102526 TaxID=1307926 RepID=A0ABT1CG62_9PROT|nr:AtzH-like domain-containing protein [Asaia lannensis]MCO6159859.1 nuclear transport factor 2 family protein [Asaia lannensis NBRC 102526]GBQ95995.1 hypothetical protein AA102526_0625 [Asaia lannensis NBRC 102526]